MNLESCQIQDRQDDPNFPKGGLNIKPSYERYNQSNNEWAKDTEEDIQTFGIAGRIWEASYLLQRYLTYDSSDRFDPPCLDLFGDDKKTIIELGAGVGLVGIHLAQQLQQQHSQSSHIVLTDLNNVLPLLARNATKAGVSGSTVKVEPLPWGSESDAQAILSTAQNESRPVTHILCSDLVYFPELLPPLLRTLIQITAGSTTKVIISYKIRSLPKEEPFWRTFGAWFDFSPILISDRKPDSTTDQQQSWRLFGAKKSDMYAHNHAPAHLNEEDAEDDVYIFVATRRPETLSCTPVSNDARLMDGFMRSENGTEIQGKGIDTFELILMACLEG